ncbi:MAG TPA: hypothetical protein VGD64_09385 [Acidisarcina sp.]
MVSESVTDDSRPQPHSLTRYFAGDRCLVESAGAPVSGYSIQRYDLRQTIQVMSGPRQYRVMPMWDLATDKEREQFKRASRQSVKRRPVDKRSAHELRIRFKYKKTGEQREIFGFPAHRWLTLRRDEHDDVPSEYADETSTEAWYLDADYLEERFPAFSRKLIKGGFLRATNRPTTTFIEHEGERPSGLCAWSRSSLRSCLRLADGQWQTHAIVCSERIVSLTEEDLPATKFEVPVGYRKLPSFPTRWSMLRTDLRNNLLRFGITLPQRGTRVPPSVKRPSEH